MQGKSKQAFSHNVGAEMDAGKPRSQALAIAYNIMKKNRKAKGGMIDEVNEKLHPEHEPHTMDMMHDKPVKSEMKEHPMAHGGAYAFGGEIDSDRDDHEDFLSEDMPPVEMSMDTYPDPHNKEFDSIEGEEDIKRKRIAGIIGDLYMKNMKLG
jgi:hypothetical protein